MTEEKKPTVLGLKKDLDEFKTEVLGLLKKLLPEDGGAQKQVEPKSQEPNVEKKQSTALPSNYQAIFEEYFDIKDGFEAEISYDDNISFTIIVPMKFSNASEAWKTYYKVDKRMKVLKQGNIEGGIKDWCILVAKNLRYNKDLQTK
jgi:hypothetical protein